MTTDVALDALPTEADLHLLLDDVRTSLLGAAGEAGACPDDDRIVSAAVRIAGDTALVATVTTARTTAERVTAMVLDVPAPDDDDVADVLGELVNILGGNVKSMLPGGYRLGLPVAGLDAPVIDVEPDQALRLVTVSWPEGRLTLSLHHEPNHNGEHAP